MRANFADIARLCAECQSLIDCHDKIAVLSEVHYNLRKTLQVGVGVRGVQGCRVGSGKVRGGAAESLPCGR